MDWSFLDSLFGDAKAPPPQPTGRGSDEAELRRLQAIQAKGYTAAQEAAARKAGYPNAAAHQAWLAQRENKTGGSVGEGQTTRGKVKSASMMHPANILQYISDALSGANKGN